METFAVVESKFVEHGCKLMIIPIIDVSVYPDKQVVEVNLEIAGENS